MKNLIFLLSLIILTQCNAPQTNSLESNISIKTWLSIESPTKSHLRGLDAAADGTIWASGIDGTVIRSIDTGARWDKFQIPNCDGIDFRDVEAFDKDFAVVMSSGNGLRIYYTEDHGLNWNLSYEDTNSSVFFDGIDFNGARGIAYGDPVDGKLAMLETSDSGKTWTSYNQSLMPETLEGEAGFAASGTGIVLGKSAIWIATGGANESRVFNTSALNGWTANSTPLLSAPSSGIFSMAFLDDTHGILVGGDYVDSTRALNNAAFTMDGGINWQEPSIFPNGYRSCVAFMEDGTAIATGRSGTDISYDEGQTWEVISDQGYYSCISIGNTLIGTGRSGKIGRVKF
jgi:photosystem II stability/assembly factor-like uncharacterized protein